MVAKYGGERIIPADLRVGDILTFAHLTVIAIQTSEDGTMVRAVCRLGTSTKEIVRLWTKKTPVIVKTRETVA